MHRKLNLLFTAVGRRVELIRIFRDSGEFGKIFAADIESNAPGLYEADGSFLLPPFSNDGCIDAILDVCDRHDIDVIVPLLDPELDFYRTHRERFAGSRARLAISSDELLSIARDKVATVDLFRLIELPCPESWADKERVDRFPIIAKPISGSSSVGIRRFDTQEALHAARGLHDGYMYQQFIDGDEITVDVLGDGAGQLCAIGQRKRLRVRGGEVERAVTVSDRRIEDYIDRFCAHTSPFGVVNLQLFVTADGGHFFTEINARMGGGLPLTCNAGVDLPELLNRVLTGQRIPERVCAHQDVHMMRFDEALYLGTRDLISRSP